MRYSQSVNLCSKKFVNCFLSKDTCYLAVRIHQVRSYGRNIAVNIWWNYWKNKEFELDTCEDKEEWMPIAQAKFHGWGDFESRDEGVK